MMPPAVFSPSSATLPPAVCRRGPAPLAPPWKAVVSGSAGLRAGSAASGAGVVDVAARLRAGEGLRAASRLRAAAARRSVAASERDVAGFAAVVFAAVAPEPLRLSLRCPGRDRGRL